MTKAYLNKIGTAVPANDVHDAFIEFAGGLLGDARERPIFRRMAERGQIESRWSCLSPTRDPSADTLDDRGFYAIGNFPSTAERMQFYEAEASPLAAKATENIGLAELDGITHLITISCTGLSAPGIDFDLIATFDLSPSIERTSVGFMGCYAAINGLKLARHIVRSEPNARVLIVSIELCTLHLQETRDLEQILSFMIFGDGCAAALITAEASGFSLDSFQSVLVPQSRDQITWNIGDEGFDMVLSGQVPSSIGQALRDGMRGILGNQAVEDIDLWAIHPGGRSVLDAAQAGLGLAPGALAASREILRCYGNMSSATILFVLKAMLQEQQAGKNGCAMAFGPGLVAETMRFTSAA